MVSRRKLWVLSVSGAAVIAIVFLAAGLSGLDLLPGRPLPRAPVPDSVDVAGGLPAVDTLPIVVWRILSILLVVLFPFAVIRFLISPQMRKRVLRDFALIVFLLLLNYLIARAVGQAGLFGAGQQAANGATPDALAGQASRETQVNPPEWLSFAVTLLLLLLLAGLGGLLWRRYRLGSSPLEKLGREARAAVDDLRAGGELKNIVTRCYAEMCAVLREQRGIRRQAAMTPREFETRLAAIGLPRENVLRLTRLFEAVRYGSKTPGDQEEREAMACLTAIAEACARLA
jgi:hypothetical protein